MVQQFRRCHLFSENDHLFSRFGATQTAVHLWRMRLDTCRSLAALFLLQLPWPGWAQQQFLQFDKTYGGPNDESGASIIAGSDGGYLLTGTTASYGPGAAEGNENGFVLKVDEFGEPQWQFALGGGGQDFFADVVRTSTGDYLITGSRVQDDNVLLIKVAPDGDVLWSKTIGSANGTERGKQIIDIGENQFVILGTRDANLFLVRIDTNGTILQTSEFTCPPEIHVSCTIAATDGTLLITGWIFTIPYQQSLVMKVGMDGNLVWARTYQQLENSTTFSGMIPTPDGGCLATGSGGDGFAALSRIDGQGNLLWRTGYTGDLGALSGSIIRFGEDRLLVGVYVSPGSGTQAPSAMILLDTLGTLVDQQTLGPIADDIFTNPGGLLLDDQGNLLFTSSLSLDGGTAEMRLTRTHVTHDHIGEFCSSSSFPLIPVDLPAVTLGPPVSTVEPPVFTSATLSWSPVAVLGSNTICSNVGLDDAPVAIRARCFPNPARDMLHFDLPLAGRPLRATISDATGRLCSAGPLSAQNDLFIGHLPSGVYHCRIECANGERFVLRFVVE